MIQNPREPHARGGNREDDGAGSSFRWEGGAPEEPGGSDVLVGTVGSHVVCVPGYH